MADIKRTIDIIFKGTDEVSKTVSKIGGDINQFSDGVGKIAGPLADFTKGVLAAEAAIIGMGAAISAGALSLFGDFQETMLTVKATIRGISEDDFKALTQSAKDAGVATRYTAQQSATALLEFARGGLNARESMDALIPTLNFVTTSQLEVGDAANKTLKILAQYGLGIGDLTRVTDTLQTSADSTTTNVFEMTEGFRKAGAVAGAMGLSVEETAAALAAYAKSGTVAEIAGTAFRNLLVAMTAPTTNVTKLLKALNVDADDLDLNLTDSATAMRKLGIEMTDSQKKILPVPEIFENIRKGLSKIPTETERAATAVTIFGKRGGPELLGVLKLGEGAVKGFYETISAGAGRVSESVVVMESGVKGAFLRLNSAIEGARLAWGEAISKGWIPAINGARDIFATLSDQIEKDGFKPVVDLINEYGLIVAKRFEEFVKIFPEALKKVEFDGLNKAFMELGKTFEQFFPDTSSPEALAKSIQTVIDVIRDLTILSKSMVDALSIFGGAVIDLIKIFGSLDEETKSTMGTLSAYALGGTVLTGLLGGFGLMIQGIGNIGIALVGMRTHTLAATAAITRMGAASTLAYGGFITLAAGAGYLVGSIFRLIPGLDSSVQKLFAWIGGNKEAMQSNEEFTANLKKEIEALGLTEKSLNKTGQAAIDFSRSIKSLGSDWEGINKEIEENAVGALISLNDEIEKTILSTQYLDMELAQIAASPLLKEKKFELEMSLKIKTDDPEFQAELKETQERLQKEISDLEIKLGIKIDPNEKKEVDTLIYTLENGLEYSIDVPIETAKAKKEVKDLKKLIDELPDDKKLKVLLEADTKQFEELQKTVQSKIEWKAKLDIAEVEANAKVIESIAGTIEKAFESTGEVISNLFGLLAGGADYRVMKEIQNQIKIENKIRSEQLELQKALTKSQIEYMDAKTKKIKAGEAIKISVTADGLRPHLQMIWFDILQALQTLINEEGADALIGL